MPGQKLMTVHDVAAELRVSTHAVYRWVADGRLRPVRAGSLLRFTEQAVADFLTRGSHETDAQPRQENSAMRPSRALETRQ